MPQDDIIHADLPLQHTLRYAARLRLPSSTTPAELDDAVHNTIDAVGLTDHADVRVGSLSGGQRKRASIAVELLTDPHVFFLDEPTSGLDLVTSAELLARLRRRADRSATVLFTTHSVDDLAVCDRIVFMARGGRLGFVGTVNEALELIKNRDRVVAKTELLDSVWGDRFVSESALTTQIKELRRAVGDTGREQRLVKTVHGRGYMFIAAVDEDTGSSPVQITERRNPILAVLPFSSLTDPGQAHVAEGLTHDIITALSKHRWLRVLTRATTAATPG